MYEQVNLKSIPLLLGHEDIDTIPNFQRKMQDFEQKEQQTCKDTSNDAMSFSSKVPIHWIDSFLVRRAITF